MVPELEKLPPTFISTVPMLMKVPPGLMMMEPSLFNVMPGLIVRVSPELITITDPNGIVHVTGIHVPPIASHDV
jgi:hypothetical protein